MKKYPKWQAMVRIAQAEQQAIDDKKQAKEVEEQRQANLKKGQQLAMVLNYFGITNCDAVSNSWQKDGFDFRLVSFGEKDDKISFNLRISSALDHPWKDSDLWQSEYLDESVSSTISIAHYDRISKNVLENPELWRQKRAQFANALDKAPQLYEEAITEWEKILTKEATAKSEPSPEENFVGALIDLLYQRGIRLD